MVPFAISAYLSVCAFFLLIKQPIFVSLDIGTYFYICSLFMIVGTSLMCSLGFYSNLIKLRGWEDEKESSFLCKVAAILVFFGTIVNIIVAILPAANSRGERSPSINLVLLSIVQIFIVLVIIPYCISKSVEVKKEPVFKVAKNTPVSGVIQDGGLILLIVTLGGIVPIYMFSLPIEIDGSLALLLNIGTIIMNVCWPLAMCLSNNVEHQKKRYKEANEYYAENYSLNVKLSVDKQLTGLYQHLRNQNILAIISTMVYACVPILLIYFGYIANDYHKATEIIEKSEKGEYKGGNVSNLKKVMNDYIPNKTLISVKEKSDSKIKKQDFFNINIGNINNRITPLLHLCNFHNRIKKPLSLSYTYAIIQIYNKRCWGMLFY